MNNTDFTSTGTLIIATQGRHRIALKSKAKKITKKHKEFLLKKIEEACIIRSEMGRKVK